MNPPAAKAMKPAKRVFYERLRQVLQIAHLTTRKEHFAVSGAKGAASL
jgi:hypothetical protein